MKIILTALLSFSSFAASESVLKIGSEFVKFEEVDGLKVNASCVHKRCEAYLKGKSSLKSKAEESKNPKAVRCKNALGGKVIIASDISGNSQAICAFPDGSYLN